VVLAILMILYMIDNLSNAMPNPIYSLAVGGVMGAIRMRSGEIMRQASDLSREASALRLDGDDAAAEEFYHVAIARYSEELNDPINGPEARSPLAGCQEALAELLIDTGRAEEAEELLTTALALREEIALEFPEGRDCKEGLASALELFGRFYQALGRDEEAKAAWLGEASVWERLTVDFPHSKEYQNRYAERLNDLAWFLISQPSRQSDQVAEAVDLARRSVELLPEHANYWNTLGTAYYYAGDWEYAMTALETAIRLNEGSTAFELFPLSVAYWHLGYSDNALRYYRQAIAWLAEHDPDDPVLRRFLAEADSLFAI
jgi:tetratricopeptide (TPR) repeat protein